MQVMFLSTEVVEKSIQTEAGFIIYQKFKTAIKA